MTHASFSIVIASCINKCARSYAITRARNTVVSSLSFIQTGNTITNIAPCRHYSYTPLLTTGNGNANIYFRSTTTAGVGSGSRMRMSSDSSSARSSTAYERVLENPKWPPEDPLSAKDFERQDESDDAVFYAQARLVYHIDDFAVAALTKYYSENLEDGTDVLDICSSWVSHYPKEWRGGNVVGLGMNEYELRQNPQLSSYNVKDLNKEPTFPYDDESFDVVTCVVSVDYLNKPKQVFKEIGRVLRTGGICMLSLSNRCFPTKAFRIWLQTNDTEHVFIAGSFFHYTGLFNAPKCDDISPNPGRSDSLFIVRATKK